MIDLDALNRSAARKDSDNALVSRRFLAQVERELREGRAAIAKLGAERMIASVTQSIVDGAGR